LGGTCFGGGIMGDIIKEQRRSIAVCSCRMKKETQPRKVVQFCTKGGGRQLGHLSSQVKGREMVRNSLAGEGNVVSGPGGRGCDSWKGQERPRIFPTGHGGKEGNA